MFSTSTQSSPMSAQPASSSSRIVPDSDVRMRDAGTAGGRKGSSRIKAHRMRGSGIDIYKTDHTPAAKMSLAARINAGDPEVGRGSGAKVRGVAGPITRARRPLPDSTVIREAIGAPMTSHVMDHWKDFINRRYDRVNKFLNLENMAEDEVLKKFNIVVPGQPGASYREGSVIFKLAGRLVPTVQTISLANNKIKVLNHFSTLNIYLPNLANLSLQNNLIEDYTELDKIAGRSPKVSLLRELILLNNPLRENEAQKGNLQHYASEVRRRFPMLEMLDQEPLLKIEFDLSSNVSRAGKSSRESGNFPLIFPLPMGGNGMAEENQGIVGQFLAKFFYHFDNDRNALRTVYAPNALFSYSANTTIPSRARVEGHHTSKEMPNQTKLEWRPWLENSRNLSRVGRSLEKAAKTLSANANDIVACMHRLPRTKHDLTGAVEKFSLDAWPVDGVLQGGQPVLFVSVHGQFAEEPSMGVRSFDRSFMVAAAPDGSEAKLSGWDVIILSDMLTVRNYSSHRAWTPGPLKVTHDSRQLEALGLPDANRQLVLQLSARTNLTYAYAAQCLSENSWDVERSFSNFEQIKGQLGPEAFNTS